MANKLVRYIGLLALLVSTGCFSMIRDPARRFYVLHVSPEATLPASTAQDSNVAHAFGSDVLVRVRDLDCESAYDKFQMVVRRSPFELVYRNKDVWAVKPGRMVSDLLARSLQQRGLFGGVTRELGERRPDWLISGDLHVLEIEQLTHEWQAHITLTLQLSNVDTGDIVWTGHFDEREHVPSHDYANAAEAVSRALARTMQQAFESIAKQWPTLQGATRTTSSGTGH